MKKSLILMGALAVVTAQAQTHKVGINTDAPKATLDISRPASGVPSGTGRRTPYPAPQPGTAKRDEPRRASSRFADL